MSKTTKNDRKLVISPAFKAATDLRKSKSDYGDIISYFPYDEKSFCHEIYKKARRLMIMARNEIEPNYESVQDNLLDLINYASYYWEYLEGGDLSE